MSAAHDTGSSESSSGYEDGLGRRVLVFDRESGEVRERLRLRPELRVFVKPLQERLPKIAGLEDERFGRPRTIDTEADGRLAVTSDCVVGRRLADIVDAAADQGIVAGLDAGLGLLLEILPALSRLHDAGLSHGAIAPGRIIVTPGAQIVLVDAIYAEALERLQLTRKRLWSELRLAFPSTAGAPRFDKAADLTQAAMTAAALIVGRPLREDEYPDGLAALRQEIVEIASIRASKGFAEGVDAFFASALPLPTRKAALTSADEAAIDLRKLLRKEVGIATCRNAMVEFFQQVDTADKESAQNAAAEQARDAAAGLERARVEAERVAREAAERLERERTEAERKAREEAERKAREEAERKAREEAERKAREEAERKAREEAERKAREEAERKAREEAERKAREEAERKAREEAERKAREEAERKAREEAERKAREEAERKAREDAERKAREEAERKAREEAERKAREEAERKAREEAERKAREEAERKARDEAERRERERLEAERLEQEGLARERAEAEAREREQREREQREPEQRERQAAAEVAAVPPPPTKSGWLVPPDRADAFDPTAGEPAQAQAQSAARAYPIYQPPAEGESWTPEFEPAPTIEIAPVAASTPAASSIKLQTGTGPTIKLKEDSGHPAGPARAENRQEPEEMSAAEAYGPFGSQHEARSIPWKLIAAGVVLIAITFGLTKGFLPSEIPVPRLGNLKPIVQLKKAPPPAVPASSGAGGHLAITTEPAGARILLDGKFVGTAPMTLDGITPGRHVITLQGDGGAIKKTVRVEPGKTISLDVPVFSGFAVISAPIVLDVAEGGRALGTTDNQIMLGAGHHELHLENKDLNYSGTHAVDIEPGETARITVDPRGRANINAIPWAEVFVDGQSIGQTPLANVAIPLGVREIVFKNPQFPERKIVTTIKAGEPATLTIDFTKDK